MEFTKASASLMAGDQNDARELRMPVTFMRLRSLMQLASWSCASWASWHKELTFLPQNGICEVPTHQSATVERQSSWWAFSEVRMGHVTNETAGASPPVRRPGFWEVFTSCVVRADKTMAKHEAEYDTMLRSLIESLRANPPRDNLKIPACDHSACSWR